MLSPEKTVLTYRLAGVGSRIAAHLLDLLILFAVLTAAANVLGLCGLAFLTGPIIVLGPFAYFILLEGLWNGQSVGKKALGLRVCMEDGRPVTFAAALARNLLRPGDMVPGIYFVGLLAMFTNVRCQRVGDLASRTVVLLTRKPVPRFTPAPHVLGEHPLERFVGDLRGMTSEEYLALRRLCDRFPELPSSIQTKLLREVWRPIAQARGVKSLHNVHDVYLAEAVVMRYGRSHGLL